MTGEIEVFHDQDVDDLSVIESHIARGCERRSSYPHIFQTGTKGHPLIICVVSPRLWLLRCYIVLFKDSITKQIDGPQVLCRKHSVLEAEHL